MISVLCFHWTFETHAEERCGVSINEFKLLDADHLEKKTWNFGVKL